MKMSDAKRVVIIVETPMQKRLVRTLQRVGVTGYTVLSVLAGSGRHGPWVDSGPVSSAVGMVKVVCIVPPERLETLLEAVVEVLERNIGVVSVTDCQVFIPNPSPNANMQEQG